MKETRHLRLHPVWYHFSDILEKTMLKGQEHISGCQSLEGRGKFDYIRDEGIFGDDGTILIMIVGVAA